MKDTSRKGLWTVSFTLREFRDRISFREVCDIFRETDLNFGKKRTALCFEELCA